MSRNGLTIRVLALLGGGALALHQLRYAVGYGWHSHDAAGGHAYLSFAGLLVAVALGVAAIGLAWVVRGSARRGSTGCDAPAFARCWVAASAALVSIHLLQELLEAGLAGGHAGVLSTPAAWIVVPGALVLGALVALALRGADSIIRIAARRRRRQERIPQRRIGAPPAPLPRFPAGVLPLNLAGRAPPPAC